MAHVGDSRAYRVRRDRIDQLTFDHSLEWELERRNQSLIGVVDMSKHRNIITRSLGPESEVEIDIEGPHPIIPGDTFVLCSDGLSNQVDDEEIGAVVREFPVERAAKILVHLANIRGGPDNSTVIVARVGELPANVQPVFVEDEPQEGLELEWSWFIGFSLAALACVLGVWMLMTGHQMKGSVITALSLISFVFMGVAAFRKQQSFRKRHSTDDGETKLLRPHRTAVALDSKGLHERLHKIESELRRAAREDGWAVNWNKHQESIDQAQKAYTEKRFSRGNRNLANAIGELMDQHPVPSGT